MRMRSLLLIAAFLSVTDAAHAFPLLTGRVLDSVDGVAAAGAPVQTISTDQTMPPAACPWTQALGSLRPDGYLFDWQLLNAVGYPPALVRVELSQPDTLGPFGSSGYFASRKIPSAGFGGSNYVMPTMGLVRIPAPTAVAATDAVRVTWSHALDYGEPVGADRGVDGYAIFRSPSGLDTFTEVGRVASSAAVLEFLDDSVGNGTWDYALKLVLPTPCSAPSHVLGADFSRRTTIVVLFDADADGITDSGDNCPAVANGTQLDSDADGIGDACEPEQPIIFVRKAGTLLHVDIGATLPVAGTVHDLHGHYLPLRTGDAATFRDPARVIIACDQPQGPSSYEFTERAARRFYLLSVVTPDGREDFGNESDGRARPRTMTLPACR